MCPPLCAGLWSQTVSEHWTGSPGTGLWAARLQHPGALGEALPFLGGGCPSGIWGFALDLWFSSLRPKPSAPLFLIFTLAKQH